MSQFGSIPVWIVIAENPVTHPQVLYGVRKILRVVKADMREIDTWPDYYAQYSDQGQYVQMFLFDRDPDDNPLPGLAMQVQP